MHIIASTVPSICIHSVQAVHTCVRVRREVMRTERREDMKETDGNVKGSRRSCNVTGLVDCLYKAIEERREKKCVQSLLYTFIHEMNGQCVRPVRWPSNPQGLGSSQARLASRGHMPRPSLLHHLPLYTLPLSKRSKRSSSESSSLSLSTT